MSSNLVCENSTKTDLNYKTSIHILPASSRLMHNITINKKINQSDRCAKSNECDFVLGTKSNNELAQVENHDVNISFNHHADKNISNINADNIENSDFNTIFKSIVYETGGNSKPLIENTELNLCANHLCNDINMNEDIDDRPSDFDIFSNSILNKYKEDSIAMDNVVLTT